MKVRFVKPGVKLDPLSDCDDEDYYEVNVSDIKEIDIDEMINQWDEAMTHKVGKPTWEPFSQYLQEVLDAK